MKFKYVLLLLGLCFAAFGACTPDETEVVVIPPRDRGEQQIVDNDSLIEYLQTHYYNKSFFSDSSENYSKDDIIISNSSSDSDGNPYELLWNDVVLKQSSFQGQDYDYYVLDLNPGPGGPTPNFTDNVSINYTGFLQDGNVFDDSMYLISIIYYKTKKYQRRLTTMKKLPKLTFLGHFHQMHF